MFGVMDLRRFITLKTVVEEGSFLRASQKLCCTQSTVTFHIQQLEQEFSVQLFEKIGRRMCLTREGKKLLPHIYELTRVMDTLREAAKKESDPDGELRVVSGETLLSYRMPQVLQRFRQRAPKVRLSLQSLNCYVIRDALLNDEADVVNNTCGSPFAAIAAGERAERAKTAAIAARVDLNMRFP